MHLLPEPAVANLLRTLTRPECLSLLSALSTAVQTVSAEAKNDSSDTTTKLVHQPLRTTITTRDNNLSLFMPVSNTTTTGIKIVTASAARGIIGVINIFSPQGDLEGLLSAAEITAFRTALAIMTLFMRCAFLPSRPNIVILGSGRQAEWHARLALLLRDGGVQRVSFVNRGRKRLDELGGCIDELASAYPDTEFSTLAKEDTPDYDDRLKSELQGADVIFSCTPATEPNFPFAYLTQVPKQRFISLIGSYKPYMKEIDTETLLSGGGRVYVDSREACLEESGELISAGVTGEQLVEIGELYTTIGEGEVSVKPGENVVFKCVGMGIMDLVVGKLLLEMGRARGLGMEVDGF